MKEETRWKAIAGIGLVTLTLLLMTVHYLLFQDSRYLFTYLLADLAFIPIEVLIVTLVIDQMLESRERQQRLEKMNMVIGISSPGSGPRCSPCSPRADPCPGPLQSQMVAGTDWTSDRFREAHEGLTSWKCRIDRHASTAKRCGHFSCRMRTFSSALWRTRWSSSTNPSRT